MIARRLLLTAAALPFLARSAFAQPKMEPAGPSLFDQKVSSHDVERHAFVSADGKRRYRIEAAVPRGRPPKGGWPSIWLLDGNAAMTALTPADLAVTPNLAVIGLGYETDQRFDNLARTFDDTPAVSSPPDNPDRPEGGSTLFRDLLLSEIQPVLRQRHNLSKDRDALWGHSFGALFVLDTLRAAPDAFSLYIPVSPSLWWHDGAWLEGPFPAPKSPRRVAVVIGDQEVRRRLPGQPPSDPTAAVAAAKALADRIGATPRIAASLTVLPGQGHGGALLASLPLALRLAAEEFS